MWPNPQFPADLVSLLKKSLMENLIFGAVKSITLDLFLGLFSNSFTWNWVSKDLICSQEESPGIHMSPREIEKPTGISRSSMRRMVKRKGLKQFKRLKTQRMSEGTRERRRCLNRTYRHELEEHWKMCLARRKRFHSGIASLSTKQSWICERQQKRYWY